MSVSLRPYGSDSPDAGYITWSPVPLVVTNSAGGNSGTLRITSRSAAGSVAKVVFLEARDKPPHSEIDVELQAGKGHVAWKNQLHSIARKSIYGILRPDRLGVEYIARS